MAKKHTPEEECTREDETRKEAKDGLEWDRKTVLYLIGLVCLFMALSVLGLSIVQGFTEDSPEESKQILNSPEESKQILNSPEESKQILKTDEESKQTLKTENTTDPGLISRETLKLAAGSSRSLQGHVVIMILLIAGLLSFLTYLIILCKPGFSIWRALTVSVVILIITVSLIMTFGVSFTADFDEETPHSLSLGGIVTITFTLTVFVLSLSGLLCLCCTSDKYPESVELSVDPVVYTLEVGDASKHDLHSARKNALIDMHFRSYELL